VIKAGVQQTVNEVSQKCADRLRRQFPDAEPEQIEDCLKPLTTLFRGMETSHREQRVRQRHLAVKDGDLAQREYVGKGVTGAVHLGGRGSSKPKMCAYDAVLAQADGSGSLQRRLQLDPSMANRVFSPHVQEPGLICSPLDGAAAQMHPYLKQYPDALVFQVYADDVEVANPIGTFRGEQKIYLAYGAIVNAGPDQMLRLINIQLLSIAFTSCLKTDCDAYHWFWNGDSDNPDCTSPGGSFRRLAAGVPNIPGCLAPVCRGCILHGVFDSLAQ
jgi:hypothetical protein